MTTVRVPAFDLNSVSQIALPFTIPIIAAVDKALCWRQRGDFSCLSSCNTPGSPMGQNWPKSAQSSNDNGSFQCEPQVLVHNCGT